MKENYPPCPLLSPFRVLDLTNEKGYYFCAKILGDLGAQVTRLEKPGVTRDFWWWSYNYKKKLVYFDIEKEQERLLQLAKEADILVDSFPPGYLDALGLGYEALRRLNPKLIMTSITNFGQTGPYKDFKVSDLELMAISGVMYEIGDADRPPVRIGFPQSHLLTAAEAAVGTTIALYQRELTGEGQQVDVSAQESVLAVMSGGPRRRETTGSGKRLGPFRLTAEVDVRLGNRTAKYRHRPSLLLWKCQNGYVAFYMGIGLRGAHDNRILAKHMEMDGDLPDIVRNMQWETFDWGQISPEDMAQIWDAIARLFARHTRQELYQMALEEKIELFPSNTVADILAEAQLEARAFWQEHEIPQLGKPLKFPGPLARTRFPPASRETQTKPQAKQEHHHLAFQGVKVLDFSWVYTGPWITQWLAVFGAEVIKVESLSHPDTGRRHGGFGFASWNTGKKSLTLNLKNPKGKELAHRLVKWADVVIENFSPGTMQKLGFGYDEMTKINPQIIMMSASMLGADGPRADQPGMGHQLTALAGFNELTGWSDRSPVGAHGPYTDITACRIAATTLFSALDYQKRTGKGCYIDVSQFEASLHFLAPLILEHQVTGRLPSRMGNRSLTDCPHGVFPCHGEDRWCAISVATDAEWQAFCLAIDNHELAQDLKFATFESRKQNEDELEGLIAGWTARFTSEEVMLRLQKLGVKAAIVATREDVLNDRELGYRRHFIAVQHPELGEYDYADSGFRLGNATPVPNPAPLLGEHNEYVAKRILGLSDEEFKLCMDSGVFK